MAVDRRGGLMIIVLFVCSGKSSSVGKLLQGGKLDKVANMTWGQETVDAPETLWHELN